MTTDERLPLIKHHRKLTGDQEHCQTEAQEDRREMNRNNIESHRNPESENTRFRLRNQSVIHACFTVVRSKFKNNRCCLW